MSKEITVASFDAEVMQSDVPVLVDFWAPWCGPCRMIGPVVEKISDDYADRLKVCKVNVDDEQALAEKYRVKSIPTLYLFKNGEVVNRLVGARSYEDLVAEINKVL